MAKKLIVTTMLVFISTVLSIFSLSAYSQATETGIPKDEWIKKFKPLAPPAMCQSIFDRESTKQIMNSHNINYNQCVSLIENSINRCVDQISPSLPNLITNDEAKKWGREIGICSGKDFYMNNIAKKT